MDEPSLRRADASDVGAIERLMADSYAKYVVRIGRPPAPMIADYAKALTTSRVWVVQRHDNVVAALVTKDRGDHLLLDAIAVAPTEQGSGLGGLLMARAERDATELGHSQIRLSTNEAMTENLTFYPAHGYRETGRGRQDGYRRVYFAKTV